MSHKLGILVGLAAIAASMSAQTPTAVGTIYSQVGVTPVEGGRVAYSVGNWYSGGSNENVSLWPAMLKEILDSNPSTLISGVLADANGIQIGWNDVEKTVTVTCDPEYIGRASVLIADYNGLTNGMVAIEQNPTKISITNHVLGAYVVAVAVDGQIVKTFKFILK